MPRLFLILSFLLRLFQAGPVLSQGFVPPQIYLSKEQISIHVHELAGVIGERHLQKYEALLKARDYVRRSFEEAGYAVKLQSYDVQGKAVSNVIAELKGKTEPAKIIVIGAHYDTVRGSPGADDNASGVASLLALARYFAGNPQGKTLRFVAFVNEEPPFFQTEAMGSLVYARSLKKNSENVVAMYSLEAMGYYSDAAGSQGYPFPLSWFFPKTGNFIGFVANSASQEFLRESVAAFKSATDFPVASAAMTEWISGIGWSDHWSFWQVGYPALIVTDTALYRNPHYHAASDTPEKLDYARLAKITEALAVMVQKFAL